MRNPDRNMQCGFIGLGSQGGPMARRMIEAGYPLTLWARRAESLQPYAGTGARSAASIAELGAACEQVAICVVDDVGVQQVCDELIPAMRAGGRIVIHSTVHPQLCEKLAEQAATRGLALLDAPVSGGGGAAAAGTLTVMVGGDAAAVAAAKPVFETFAGLIVHLGGVGAGQTAKLVNNTLMAAHFAIAHHALSASEQLGIDRKALAQLVAVSSGRSFGFDVYARQASIAAFAHGAKLLEKDVRLLGEALGDSASYAALRDVATPVLALATQA
jgi:3-hydroxyisobutyrate dehydrogenase-like beta-hydroxyacid dehydrogenase